MVGEALRLSDGACDYLAQRGIELLIGVQVVNGFFLPITLFFVWRLSRNAELMGEYKNGRVFDFVAAATVLVTGALSIVLVGLTLAGKA